MFKTKLKRTEYGRLFSTKITLLTRKRAANDALCVSPELRQGATSDWRIPTHPNIQISAELGMLRAPKRRATKAQANGLGLERDPILLSERALRGRNNRELASSSPSSRCVRRVITPLQGWRITRRGIFTQADGLGFVRPPRWGFRKSAPRQRGWRGAFERPDLLHESLGQETWTLLLNSHLKVRSFGKQ